MQHVETVLRSVIGRPFEFECSEIIVKGILDHEEPLFQGPGTISGGVDGQIAFRLFDQSPERENRLPRILESINSQQSLRLFGTDFHETQWTGGWFVPDVRFSDGGHAVVSGELPSIGARVKVGFGAEWTNSTALYYAEKLAVPMQSASETEVRRDDEIVFRSRRTDHSRISDSQFSIEIREDLTSGFTEVIAQNRPGLMPPIAEIGLADALAYVLCRISRPRVVVRSSDNDAQIIIRVCTLNARTRLPDPIGGHPQKTTACWEIVKAFLRQYVGWEELSPVATANHLYEVISASNGTVHGFMASLVLAIEGLFSQLGDPPSEELKEVFNSLHQYLAKWPGDGEMKERAQGLLSGLARRSHKSILQTLANASVLRPEEVESWLALRP